MPLIRAAVAEDLPQIAAIQANAPEAAQWPPQDYLQYDLRVCIEDGAVAGFAVARDTAPGECELLNLAVDENFRRRGIGKFLLESLLESRTKMSETGGGVCVFLEVRESNASARAFYKWFGFQEVSVRPKYYDYSSESAIVMKFHSC